MKRHLIDLDENGSGEGTEENAAGEPVSKLINIKSSKKNLWTDPFLIRYRQLFCQDRWKFDQNRLLKYNNNKNNNNNNNNNNNSSNKKVKTAFTWTVKLWIPNPFASLSSWLCGGRNLKSKRRVKVFNTIILTFLRDALLQFDQFPAIIVEWVQLA